MKKLIRTLLFLCLICILYLAGVLLYGTLFDYQPRKVLAAEIVQTSTKPMTSQDTFSILTWNIGYCGQGKDMALFFDAGHFYTSGTKMKRQSKKLVQENIAGVDAFLQKSNADFILLQEVDTYSKRSHYSNQMEIFSTGLKDYEAHFFPNYKVDYNPIPLLEFWNVYGKTNSGLGVFSKHQASENLRLQLPGSYGWPTRIFHLDRCIAYSKYPLSNGKNLVVLNIHNSAYDEGGYMKKKEVEFFRELVLSEYKQGNYVVAGGDWNQLPPDISLDLFMPSGREHKAHYNIDKQLFPQDWTWSYDTKVPTNRDAGSPYQKAETFVKLIDYFLVSPNVKILKVEGINLEFEHADHQPVKLQVQLDL